MRLILLLGLAGFASAFSLRSTDPMLAVMADDLSVTIAEAALLASAFSIPYAVMQLVWGPVGDAVGKTRLIRLALAVLTLGLLLSALAPDYATVMAARILAGAFAGGIIPTSMALIGDRVPYAGRQLAISRFLVAVISGHMLGSAAAGLLAEFMSWRMVFALSAGLTALILLAALLGFRGEREARVPLSFSDARRRYETVLANPVSLMVFLVVAVEGLLVLGVFPFVAPLLLSEGLGGAAEAGLALVAFAAGGLVYTTQVRRLLRLFDQWRMMSLGGVVIGLTYLGVAAAPAWLLVALAFLVAGFGYYMLHNTLQTQATELAPGARGSAVALFAAALFLGQGLGPPLYGPLAPQVGYPALFVGAGLLTVVLGFVAVRLIRR